MTDDKRETHQRCLVSDEGKTAQFFERTRHQYRALGNRADQLRTEQAKGFKGSACPLGYRRPHRTAHLGDRTSEHRYILHEADRRYHQS
jgi:hypothetical protein